MIGDEGRGRRERAEGKGRKDVRTNERSDGDGTPLSLSVLRATYSHSTGGGRTAGAPSSAPRRNFACPRAPPDAHEHSRALPRTHLPDTFIFLSVSLFSLSLSLSFLRFLPAVPAHGGHTQIKCNGSARCPYGTSLARRYRHCCQPCRRRHHHRRPTDDDDDGAAPRSPTDGHHARADADA